MGLCINNLQKSWWASCLLKCYRGQPKKTSGSLLPRPNSVLSIQANFHFAGPAHFQWEDTTPCAILSYRDKAFAFFSWELQSQTLPFTFMLALDLMWLLASPGTSCWAYTWVPFIPLTDWASIWALISASYPIIGASCWPAWGMEWIRHESESIIDMLGSKEKV